MSKPAEEKFGLSLLPVAAGGLLLALLCAGWLTPAPPALGQAVPTCGNGLVEAGEACDPGGRCSPIDGSVCNSDGDCPSGARCIALGGDGDCCSATCQVEESMSCGTCDDGEDNDHDQLADRFDPECASLYELYGEALVATDNIRAQRGADFASESSVRSFGGSERSYLSPSPPYPPYAPYPLGPSGAASCLPSASFGAGSRFDGPVALRGRSLFSTYRLGEVGPTMFAGIPADSDPMLFAGLPGLVSIVPPGTEIFSAQYRPLLGIGTCRTAGTPCVTDLDCPGVNEPCQGKFALSDPAAVAQGLVDRTGTAESFVDCLAALDELGALPDLLRQLAPTRPALKEIRLTRRSGDKVITLADDVDEVLDLASLRVGYSRTLTLRGNPKSLILRVRGNVEFWKSSHIVLAGGLTPDRVLWFLDGKARLSFASRQRLAAPSAIHVYGTFVALDLPTASTIGSNSRLSGALFSKQVKLSQRATLEHVPFSPLLPIDLKIEKTGAPNPPNPALAPDVTTVVAGENLRYTLSVTYSGPSYAPAVTVTDTLPGEVEFVAATPSRGTCLHDGHASGGTVTCYLGTLARADQEPINLTTIIIDVRVRNNIDGNILNTARVSAAIGETKPSDNQASLLTPVITLCDIFVGPPTAPTFALVTDSGASNSDGITNVPDVVVHYARCGTWEYQVDNAGWLTGSGSGFQLSPGSHSYVVRHTDQNGTLSPASDPRVFEYKSTSALLGVTLVDASDAAIAGDATHDASATLAVSGIEVNAEWSYLVDLGDTWTPGSGNHIPLVEGKHEYVIRQIDVAGNQSGTGGGFTRDTSGIGTLTMALVEDTGTPGDGITANPLVQVSGIKAGAIWEYNIDGHPVWTRGKDDRFELIADTHVYSVRQSDDAGNKSTSDPVEFSLSTGVQIPLLRLEVDSGPGEGGILVDGISNQPKVLVYYLESAATWEYRIDGGAWITGVGDSFNMLQDGTKHSYFARQTSVGGVRSLESPEAMLQFDNVPPAALGIALVSDSGLPSDGITNVSSIQIIGLDEGDLFEYQLDGGAWLLWRSDVIAMQVGTHSYAVRRYDVAGNVSTVTSATFTYLNADVGAPTLVLNQDAGIDPSDRTTNLGQVNVIISGADPAASWEYQVDNGAWQPGSGHSFQAIAGVHTYRVRQSDVAGNNSPASDPFTVHFLLAAPVFISLNHAVVADPDSERQTLIGTNTVLYTAEATDPDGNGVTYGLLDDSLFTIDHATGALRFKEPIGYILGGANVYTAQIIAISDAGNSSQLNVEVQVVRTNSAAPQIDLGEVKTGVLTPDAAYDSLILHPQGGSLGKITGTLKRLSSLGEVDTGFTPVTVGSNVRVVVDGQGRIYVVSTGGLNFSVTRYGAGGTLDSGYGSGGTVTFSPSSNTNLYRVTDVGVRSDGTLFAVGEQEPTSSVSTAVDSALWIASPNGAILTNSVTNFIAGATDVNLKVLPGSNPGHLYVLNLYTTTNILYRLHRYINGALDSSFGSGGEVAFGIVPPKGAWVDPQGRILILTNTGNLTRYSANGVVDGSYSAPTLPVGDISGVAFAADGGLFYFTSDSAAATVRRLNANGALNTSFGANGVLSLGPKSHAGSVGGTAVTSALSFDESSGLLNLVGNYSDTDLVRLVWTITQVDSSGVLDDRFGDVALTITEGNRPIAMLTTAANIIDIDNAGTNYGGVTVTIERQGGANSDDIFAARGDLQLNSQGEVVWGATVVGSYTQGSGRLEIIFNQQATHTVFDGVLRALTYYNSSQHPTALVRLAWTVNDHDPAGARSTSATQTINIADDFKDVGDGKIITPMNGATTTLKNYALINGRHYYLASNLTHDQLDQRFNGGSDTTDTARTVVQPDGSTFKLLTQSELVTLRATPNLPSAYVTSGFTAYWTASLGSGPGNHVAYAFGSYGSRPDSQTGTAFVEAIPSPFTVSGPVTPQLSLAEDNGDLPNDNLTSNGRVNILGFERALPHDYSTDGGTTWTSRVAGSELFFILPEGVYPVGMLKARQTDQSGFNTEVANTAAFSIDKTIRSMQLLNDQGLDTGDNITADGRVVINNFDSGLPYEYSGDGGTTWQAGGPLGTGLGFTLPAGIYSAGDVRVRQVVAGFTTGTANNTTYIIDSINGQGVLDLATDTGESASDGLTSDQRITITGFRDVLPWEYTTNGGTSWLPGTQTSGAVQSFTLAEGNYAVGTIRARQTDAAGFITQFNNAAAFIIDLTIGNATIVMVNDTGISNTDLTSADGTIRITLSGIVAGDIWEYTIDSGKNWTLGIGASGIEFVLANGSYTALQVMARLSDGAGNQSVTKFEKAFRIDNTDTQAPVFTSPARTVNLDADADGAGTIATGTTLHTPAITDANFVVYSLSGPDASLFNIDPNTGKLTFRTATGYRVGGPNSYHVTILATDLFGNAAPQDVTIELKGPPKLASTVPGNGEKMPTAGALALTFDTPVRLGTGTISLRHNDTGQMLAFDVQDASQVSVSGNTVTIQPSTALADGASYGVLAAAGSVVSEEGFPWAGISTYWTWQFGVSNSLQLQATGVVGVDNEVKITQSAEDVNQASFFANSVSRAGDVNGDGRDDFLVALTTADPSGRIDAGRIYVVFGTDSPAAIDLAQVAAGNGGFVINGATTKDQAGKAVAAIGDFNGDGKADIVVTAPPAAAKIGTAYVIYGKTTGTPVELSTIAAGIGGFSIVGNDAVSNFNRVAGIGDFNGDGFPDIALGSTGAKSVTVQVKTRDEVKEWSETKTWQTSSVDVVKTTEPVTVVNPFAIYDVIHDPLSFAVENAGDLVTNPKMAFTNDDTVFRNTTKTTTTTTTWTQTTYYKQTTTYTTTTTITSPSAGLVYVLFGGRGASAYQNLTLDKISRSGSGLGFSITGDKPGGGLGSTLTPIGDVDGDGYSDFYLSSRAWFNEANVSYVVLGNNRTPASLTPSDLARQVGGYSVTDSAKIGAGIGAEGLGDLNGDGYADFAVNTYGGRVYVVYGKGGNANLDLGTIDSGSGGFVIRADGRDEAENLYALGDVSGDGIPDLMATDGSRNVWVIYGKGNSSAVNLADIKAGIGGFHADASSTGIDGAAGVGDFNGDGLNDILFLLNDYPNLDLLYLLPGATEGLAWKGTHVNQLGTTGDDSLSSSGGKSLVGKAGNDVFTSNGADVLYGGDGNDSFVVSSSMATALAAGLGAAGNTNRLAAINGGGGSDTIVSMVASLVLNPITRVAAGTPSLTRRLANIERVDLAQDPGVNELSVRPNDVAELASMNRFNTGNGWTNQSGATLAATTEQHQLLVDGGANDKVRLLTGLGGFTSAGTVQSPTGEVYRVYSGSVLHVQLLIKSGITII